MPSWVTTYASRKSRLDGDEQRRFFICHNPDEAQRGKARRDQTLARFEAELARIEAARTRTRSKRLGRRRDAEAAAHTRAGCALRDHSVT